MSPRLLGKAPFGDAIGFDFGLGEAEPVAVTGALIGAVGAILGVLRADIVGVMSSSVASDVRNGVKAGRLLDDFAESGRTMASIVCSSCDSNRDDCSFKAEPADLPAPLRILINDAGVTGLLSVGGMGADCDPGFATIGGDLLPEADFGVAGGGIKISDNDSGDIDSASELSWLMATGSFSTGCCVAFSARLAFPASSMISEIRFEGILVLEVCFFLVCGFVEGDCRTVREWLR